jgi:hypothetical protein
MPRGDAIGADARPKWSEYRRKAWDSEEWQSARRAPIQPFQERARQDV